MSLIALSLIHCLRLIFFAWRKVVVDWQKELVTSCRTHHSKVSTLHCGTVADWLERSACNSESMGSSLVRDSYCVRTLSKFFTYNCSAILMHLCRQGI